MSISIRSDLQAFLEAKIKNGEYRTVDDAINSLLSQMRALEELNAGEIDELRAELDGGISEANCGVFEEFTAEDVIAERHAARKKVS